MASPYTNIKFSDAAMPRIAQAAGYSATPYNKEGFQQFLAQNPDAKAKYEQFQQQAVGTMMAARGGVVRFVDGGMVRKYAEGGDAPEGVATYEVTKDRKTGYTDVGPLPGPENDPLQEPVGPPPFAQPPILPDPPFVGPDDPDVGPNDPQPTPDDTGESELQVMERERLAGNVPESARVTAQTTQVRPDQDVATGTGQISQSYVAQPSEAGKVTEAEVVDYTAPAEVIAAQTSAAVEQSNTQAAQSEFDQQIIAAQQNESSVSRTQAAQGTATLINSPANREIQAGELISPVANAEKATMFTEQVQAAQASPTDKATVQGQLEQLYSDFDGKNPPAWAAGAMRAANAAMAARGLSSSSLAGQAVVQATMEAAIPIAQVDANTFAQFEVQNLSNRQQRAMLAAQQRAQFIGQEFDQAFQTRVANSARIADIANMNFNAEQQVILENSRTVNTMNLANLNNRQAVVMAEAAALSQLDMANLNNRQQAAVQNAQNFLQVDMSNLSARQQTAMFDAQSRVQAIFTDAAATNAARQFNATSANQTNQFFASLNAQVSQFNSAQNNAMEQFNLGQSNAINQFNANVLNQREQFNAQNELVIAQSNAQWRRQIATADTAAINRANEFNATAALGVSNQAYNNIQQFMRDSIFKAIDSAENALDRETRVAVAILQQKTQQDIAAAQRAAQGDGFISDLIGKGIGKIFDFGFDSNNPGNFFGFKLWGK